MDISSITKALELARQKLDEEIQPAFEAVRQLRARRNTFAYISRLPTEVISRIFVTLAYSCLDRSDPDLSWIPSVSAVCERWRTIALECPNLWSYIVFSRPKWVEEMLKRSKMAPLIIKADIQYPPQPGIVDAVRLSFQHISRITELRLTAPTYIIANLIEPIDKPTPLLQSLHLQDPDTNLWSNMYTLAETHFVCGDHRLHRLELVNCRIPWESPLLCGLTHFKFTISSSCATQLPVTQLLDVLEKMPLLETLDLEGLFPVLSDDTNRVVHLSHLKSLRLSHTVPDGPALRKSISFPASTSLVLFCQVTSGNDYSTVCDAVSSVWNGTEGSQLLRCLVIDTTRLRGWTTSESADKQPSKPSQIEVELSGPNLEDTDDVIINLCNALTLTNLRTLFIYGVHITTATWLNIFGHLTSLRALHFNGWHSFELVLALSKTLKDTEEVCLSGLHDLWLNDTTYKYTIDNKTFFEELRDCLMTRCHWNAELHGLHLRDCTQLYVHDVELLKEIVVDVDWDWITW